LNFNILLKQPQQQQQQQEDNKHNKQGQKTIYRQQYKKSKGA